LLEVLTDSVGCTYILALKFKPYKIFFKQDFTDYTLGNQEDELRYSEVDIKYTVTVDNGAKIESGGTGNNVNVFEFLHHVFVPGIW